MQAQASPSLAYLVGLGQAYNPSRPKPTKSQSSTSLCAQLIPTIGTCFVVIHLLPVAICCYSLHVAPLLLSYTLPIEPITSTKVILPLNGSCQNQTLNCGL